MTDPVPTVFFGSGGFAVPILTALLEAPEIVVRGVVTAPDRPVGRHAIPTPTPVAAFASTRGITLLQPAGLRGEEPVASIAALGVRLGILADFGRIVPPSILGLPTAGILNLHPSLLPRWRGASPIPATVLAGDRETGVTVIRMDAGLDTGPIVATERWGLDGGEDAPGLETHAADVAAGLIRRIVGPWLRGEIEPRPQGADGVTLTRPLRRDDGRLDPTLSAKELERRVRAFRPWPGTFLDTTAGRVVVLDASPDGDLAADRPADFAPGHLGADGLTTADGILVLTTVQPAGGRPMTWAELLRGRPGLVGSVVAPGPA